MNSNDVISNLEQQIRWIEDIECHQFPGWMNVTNAMRDAVAQLKKSKPRILTPEEFAGTFDYVWVETRISDVRSGLLIADVYIANDGINYRLQIMGNDKMPILLHSQLGKCWRCWDKKPTDEQMRAVKWDE